MNNKYKFSDFKKISINILLWSIAALGWWGMMFTDFTMTTDTYKVVDESGQPVDEDEMSGMEIYRDILRAKPGHVRPRSKIVDTIRGIKNEQGSKSNNKRIP